MSKTVEMAAEVNLLLNEVNDVLAKTKDYSMINEAEFDVQYPTGVLSFDYKACRYLQILFVISLTELCLSILLKLLV